MSHRIRQPGRGDGTAAARLIRAWADQTPWITEYVNDDTADLAAWREGYIAAFPTPTWIAEDDSGTLGFCLREDDNISALDVNGPARNRGIGKRLLDCAKHDRTWITVWAYLKNEHARRFYTREGLVAVCCEPEEETGLMNIEHRWLRDHPAGGWLR